NEFSKIYAASGGTGYNAWTSVDATNYIINLPSNKLELWAAVESDRMKNHVLREYYQERDVVMEERRSRFENNPEGTIYEQLIISSFENSPYKHPVIGLEEDLKYLPKAKVEEFLDRYYLPNNCIISVVGDIEAAEVITLIDKYFGDIRGGEIPKGRVYKGDIDRGEINRELRLEANPKIMISYHKPNLPHKDDYVFDIIDSLLTQGRTSRLHKRLVLEDKVAVAVSSGTAPGTRYENLFMIDIVPKEGHSSKEIIAIIEDEIGKLQTHPPTQYELQKVINNLEAEMIRAMRGNEGIASKLAYYEAIAGDWRYMVEHINNVRNITPEDIRETAGRYLSRRNRTIVEIVKRGGK
ncbi:MAG: insulinase family protein, partial [Nitrospinae bacterium]|nr:insulinase family protein [Nitrospinota bacterium]